MTEKEKTKVKKKVEEDSLDWIKSEHSGVSEAASHDGEHEVISGDIILEGSLGMAEAEAMHQMLSKVLEANVDISIQSESLSRIDAAGAQLLYAFIKESKQRTIALKWASVSDVLRQTVETLGLSEGMRFDA